MKNQTEPLEHASVRQYCKAVRVPAIGSNFVSLAEQAVKENQTHVRYLAAQSARVLLSRSAPREGVGNAGCSMHPQPRVYW